MASEIRANKLTNRAGLGTVTYADTGIIVSGIVTCTELSGLTALNISGVGTASTLDINGDIDVDGHTNLDNVSVAGVSTFNDRLHISSTAPVLKFTETDNSKDFFIVGDSNKLSIRKNTTAGGNVVQEWMDNSVLFRENVDIDADIDVDGHTNLDNVSIAGVTTTSGNIIIENAEPSIFFTDTNGNPDYKIFNDAGALKIYDTTYSATRLQIGPTNGEVTVASNTNFPNGITMNPGTASVVNTIAQKIGDTDTKIRFPAADTFSVETAGSERLRITSGGNVGIGTNSPYNTGLDVRFPLTTVATFSSLANGTQGANVSIIHTKSGITDNDKVGQISFSGGALGNATTYAQIRAIATDISNKKGDIAFYMRNGNNTTGSLIDDERLRITSDGNVGIGTDNPQVHLNVFNPTTLGGTESNRQDLARFEGHVANDGMLEFANIRISNGSDWQTSTFRIQRRIDSTRMGYIDFGTGAGSASGGAGRDIQFGSGDGIMMMHLDSQGSVGLGTVHIATNKKLDVCDGIISVQGTGSHDSRIEFLRPNTNAMGWIGIPNWGDTSLYIFGPTATSNEIAAAYGGGAWNFYTSGGSNAAKLTIDTAGLTALKNFNGTGLRLQGSGGNYQGMQLQVTDASSSQTRNVFIDVVNETGAAIANQVGQIQSDGGSHWAWQTQPSGNRSDRRVERLRLDSDGTVILKNTAAATARSDFMGTLRPISQIASTWNAYHSLTRHDAGSSYGPYLFLAKNRNDAYNSNGAVQDNDECGNISFLGNDGTAFRESARIRGEVDGTPGSSQVPGAITFATNGGSGVVERARITKDGNVYINTSTVNAGGANPKLSIDGGDSNISVIQVQAGGGENNNDLAGISFSHGNTGDMARPKAAIAFNRNASYGRGDLCFYVDNATDNNTVSSADLKLNLTKSGQLVVQNGNIDFNTAGTGIFYNPGAADAAGITFNSNELKFYTQNTHRFSLDTSGYLRLKQQVFIRNNAPTIYLQDTDHHAAMIHQNSGLFYVLRASGTDSTSWVQHNNQWPLYIRMDNNNAYFGGSVYSAGTLLTGSSDLRLKKNLVKIQTPLEKISKLTGYNFDWNDNVIELGFTPDIPTNDVGLIAQDVQEVAPQAVQHAPFDQEYDKETKLQKSKSGENYLTVQYEKLVPLLVEAIKELKAEVDALKSS